MTFEAPYAPGSSTVPARRTLTAFFDTREQAEEAVAALKAADVQSADIQTIEGSSTDTTSAAKPYREEGFWASLTNLFVPDEDRHGYAEGLRRGGYVVAVVCDESEADRVADILDRDGSVDFEERTDTWRSEGWSGGADRTLGTSEGSLAYQPGKTTTQLEAGNDANTKGDFAGKSVASGAPEGAKVSSGEQSLPIAEEELRIGKREVGRGSVRVRSYIVEEPVSEDVRLREERVRVEQRKADRPATGISDPFVERTIEIEQRGEEPVVSKDTRITGEVVLTKEETFRTEKVEDTVRRTEVEIEDGRTGSAAATPTAKTESR